MTELVWPSGVGGQPCDECGDVTIVRGFDLGSDALAEERRYLCRECVEGDDGSADGDEPNGLDTWDF